MPGKPSYAGTPPSPPRTPSTSAAPPRPPCTWKEEKRGGRAGGEGEANDVGEGGGEGDGGDGGLGEAEAVLRHHQAQHHAHQTHDLGTSMCSQPCQSRLKACLGIGHKEGKL